MGFSTRISSISFIHQQPASNWEKTKQALRKPEIHRLLAELTANARKRSHHELDLKTLTVLMRDCNSVLVVMLTKSPRRPPEDQWSLRYKKGKWMEHPTTSGFFTLEVKCMVHEINWLNFRAASTAWDNLPPGLYGSFRRVNSTGVGPGMYWQRTSGLNYVPSTTSRAIVV